MKRSGSYRLAYANGRIDRAEHLRQDAQALAHCVRHSPVRVVALWRSQHHAAGDGRVHVEATAELLAHAWPQIFLGLADGQPLFAIDCSAVAADAALHLLGGGEWFDLRQRVNTLDADSASLLAYARGLVHWQHEQRHCSRCGSPNTWLAAGHEGRCSRADCARQVFPNPAPAVIMLVEQAATSTQPARCLLAQHRGPTLGARVAAFSTLAGFVQVGESLEQAVVREVHEETGVHVDTVRYQASQPWPFPDALMLGFHARALSHALTLDHTELSHAQWFSAEELRRFAPWHELDASYRLPRRDSIAWQLLNDWLRAQTPRGVPA